MQFSWDLSWLERRDHLMKSMTGSRRSMQEKPNRSQKIASLECFFRFSLYNAGFVSKITSIMVRFYAGDRSVLESDDVHFNRMVCRFLVVSKSEDKGESIQDSSRSPAIVKTGLIYLVHPSCFCKGIYKIGDRNQGSIQEHIQVGNGRRILQRRQKRISISRIPPANMQTIVL